MAPVHVKVEEGPVTRGKGLDALDRFLVQNWPPSVRFGLWTPHSGTLAPRKVSLEHFLDEALKAGWAHGEAGAVITIDSPGEPVVAIRLEIRAAVPGAAYNPKHWVWKVASLASVLADLEATGRLPLAEAEAEALRGLTANA